MKVLQLCHKIPNPPVDGGAQVMHFTTKGLIANGVHVKTVAINPTRQYVDEHTIPAEYKSATAFEFVVVDTKIKLHRILANVFSSDSYFMTRFVSDEFKERLITILKREVFDIIQIEHVYLCHYLNVLREHSNAKIVLRPQNVEAVIWERYLAGVKNPFVKLWLRVATSRLRKFENKSVNLLDGILALTPEDAEIFRGSSTDTPVVVIPMGYDYERIVGHDFNLQHNGAPLVYHIASMDWLPNVEAMDWFFEKVYPILQRSKCVVKISIAGRAMPERFFKYSSPSVEVTGLITDPLKFQEDKSVMIVPLWSGSGIRAKIIEGLALGKTIISTSIGAQGINYENGKNILIADTPEAFAECIIRCVSSPELIGAIGQEARELSLREYHFDAIAKRMIAFYEQIL